MKQKVTILGSTGSIGVQTLDIIRERPDEFEVTTLTASVKWEELARQAIAFDADSVVITDSRYYAPLKEALSRYETKVYSGDAALVEVCRNSSVDIVVNALVGYAGLLPTVATLETGKKLALANKESLVVGGEYVMRLAIERGVPILPIDSEHSAIFQCLVGESSPIRRLILTCSGGAFRDYECKDLPSVTVQEALRHPKWSMGSKITIDSSTLVNKGFEVIEAHWLFGVETERIDVIQHRESVVHSMVEFDDGAIKAQLGTPDMHMPISYAMMFPKRASRPTESFSFLDNPTLHFEEVNREKYPALDVAYDCLRQGGTASCVMNGANEVAVEAFLSGKCGYLDIVETIKYALERCNFVEHPTLDDYALSNIESRERAKEYLKIK